MFNSNVSFTSAYKQNKASNRVEIPSIDAAVVELLLLSAAKPKQLYMKFEMVN